MNSYQRFCFNLLGKRVKGQREKYSELRKDLLSARIPIPFEVYLSTAFVTSVLVGLLAAVSIGAVTYIFQLTKLVTYRGAVPDSLVFVAQFSLLLGTIAVTLISLVVFGGLTYLVYNLYPSIQAGNRRRNIDATLPYAINYITAMSTAGIPPAEIFRQLADSPIYGESSVEARYIVREIDMFGKDLIDALRITSVSTPSMRMKEFIQGAMGNIASGSNLTVYFRTKADQYAIENRQTQILFLDTLGLIAESYVTAMVAGPLFLIILQSIMSVIGNQANPIFLYVIIYLMIPFGSIMFVIMISSMTPEG
jgi:archaeal flagellar protein FlaJ